ncbi:MAG: RNB domain-containing ribonuclease [Planctomycetota bacterium]|nr:RNB domain-containing ribonuclease [Planctomycetota bacterium]
MPEIFKKRIIELLKHANYEPVKLPQLARALGVRSEDYEAFKLAFDQLRQAGHVVIGGGNLVSLPSLSGRIVGTFRANPKGFGFVMPLEPHAHGDLFIPPSATASAMTGDIVAAKVTKKGERAGQMRYSGEVIEVLEHAQNQFIGTLLKAPQVIEVLGKAGQYDSEIKSIIHQFHLPTEFDAPCLEQARAAAAEFDPERPGTREDITNKVIITIDPPDAKDFDDAISLEKDSKGNCALGVHIADVSFFLPQGSPLDAEAKAVRQKCVYNL